MTTRNAVLPRLSRAPNEEGSITQAAFNFGETQSMHEVGPQLRIDRDVGVCELM